MGFLLLSYFATFVCILQGRRIAALSGLAISTLLSIAMFLYHTTSSLDLNF